MNQFFIYSSLPPLEFGSKPDIDTGELMDLFETNLNQSDFEKVKVLKRWIDIQNIYTMFSEGNFDKRGNYSENTLKELLRDQRDLPSYVFEFLDENENDSKVVKNFSKLMSQYFQEEKAKASKTLYQFLDFEYKWRVLMAGYRTKALRRDVAKELQYEDMQDPVVAMTIAQKDTTGDFVFPFEYKDLESAINNAGPNPLQKYEVIAQYRFNFYLEIYINYPFSLQACLAYLMALWILEDYYSFDQKEGERVLDQIVEKEDVS